MPHSACLFRTYKDSFYLSFMPSPKKPLVSSVQFICDIAQVSQASFAVDILRRKGRHRYKV